VENSLIASPASLNGSNTWVEFDGTSVTRKVWDGRADLEEFETDSKTTHIEGLTLRLYNPQSHQWPLLGQQQGRRHERLTPNRRIQEWTRRVFLPGHN
jgi:hypothetical protein